MLNKRILMVGASAFAIVAVQAATPAEAGMTNWDGFYVGGHVGAGQANWDGVYNPTDSDSAVFFDRIDTEGILAGAQVGYNMMAGNVLLGIEGDFTWMDWQGDSQAADSSEEVVADVDYLFSIRGRLGVAVDPGQRAVLYATAGVAWADADATFYDSGQAETDVASFSFDDAGGVLGGGVEWAASQSIRVRAEGLYYWFDDDKDMLASCGGNTPAGCEAEIGDRIEFEDVYTFRVGASWYFNAPAPVHHASMK